MAETNEDFRYYLKNKDIEDHLRCGMCDQLAIDPQECQDCKKLFCKQCLENYKAKGQTMCPACKKDPIQELKPNKFLLNEIDIKEVNCKNDQCKETIILSFLHQHIKQCKYNKVKCPNKSCTYEGFAMNFEKHKEECRNEQVNCKKCDKPKGDDHDCLKNLLQIVNDYNDGINFLGSELIKTQKIIQILCKRFNALKLEEIKITVQEKEKKKNNKRECKKQHKLKWIGYSPDYSQCADCNKDEYTIRYICVECDEGYCQKCRIPVFNGNQCPAKHIMNYDASPDDGIMCDFCGEYPEQNEEGAFSDRFCNFDICKSCFERMSD